MQLIVRNADLSIVPVGSPKSDDFSGRAYGALLTSQTATAFQRAIQEFVGGLSQNPTEREMLVGLFVWVRTFHDEHETVAGLNIILAKAQQFFDPLLFDQLLPKKKIQSPTNPEIECEQELLRAERDKIMLVLGGTREGLEEKIDQIMGPSLEEIKKNWITLGGFPVSRKRSDFQFLHLHHGGRSQLASWKDCF